MTLYGIVSEFSDRVNDGRTNQKIYNHAMGEMVELQSELLYERAGIAPGADGIVGEAIDVIACMMDIIRKNYPDITEEQLEDIMLEKCTKWERKVNAGEYTDR